MSAPTRCRRSLLQPSIWVHLLCGTGVHVRSTTLQGGSCWVRPEGRPSSSLACCLLPRFQLYWHDIRSLFWWPASAMDAAARTSFESYHRQPRATTCRDSCPRPINISFLSSALLGGCGALHNNYVSRHIKQLGHWRDCALLIAEWRHAGRNAQNAATGTATRYVFTDVGANIGACTLEVLLPTDARIVEMPNSRAAAAPVLLVRCLCARLTRFSSHRSPFAK